MDGDSDAAEKRQKTEKSVEDAGEMKPLSSTDGSSGTAAVAKARWSLLRQVQPIVEEREEKFRQTIGALC